MATKTILPQTTEIIEAAYAVTEPLINEHIYEFLKVLDAVRSIISHDQHEALYDAVMQMVANVKEESFKAGWSIRSQI